MPRKTKEIIEEEKDTKKKSTKTTAKTTTVKSKSAAKKATTSKKSSSSKSVATKSKKKVADSKETSAKKTTKKTVTTKKTTKSTTKSASTKNSATKTTTRKTAAKATKKAKTTTRKRTTKSKAMQPEYYDLPYGYNQTVIKLLAQTPKTIFVYWEISTQDVEKFITEYGDNFFYNTMPVLSVYNEDKDYYFDVIINDFANSWYINVPDEDSKYRVQLKRVFKEPISEEKQFVEIVSSNEIIIPNGHVHKPFPTRIEYINLKTNEKYFKDVYYHKHSYIYNTQVEEFGLNNPSSDFGRI